MIGKKPTGTKITLDEDGKVVVEMGSDMTMKTKGTIEGKLLAAKEAKVRMKGVLDTYKPEYLEYGTRVKVALGEIKEKGGIKLSPEDKKQADEYFTFRRRAAENINLYIKDITGAQMSEPEANRLKRAVPDPGAKWYEGDSPTEFKSKADDVMLYSQAAELRFQWYLSKGLDKKSVVTMMENNATLDGKPLKSLDAIVDSLRKQK